MKVLIHLEPISYRVQPLFVSGHLTAFIKPILHALAAINDSDRLTVGMSSNIFICLESLQIFRELEKDFDISPVLFPIHPVEVLRGYNNSIHKYCKDLYNSDESDKKNCRWWPDYFKILFHEFNPNIVATTSDNRHLMNTCESAKVPLLSTEFGLLPREMFPLNRFVNIGGHINTDLLSSVSRARNQIIQQHIDVHAAKEILEDFESSYFEVLARDERSKCAKEFFSAFQGKNIALLALQPSDWITWEGALGRKASPSEILLKALARIKSDILIVTFHADRSGDIPESAFTDIWLSDSRIEKLPNELTHDSSEFLLPFVHEFLSVSSNVAFTAFVLGIDITPISSSFVRVLSRLQKKGWNQEICRASLLTLFVNKHSVDNRTFQNPLGLAKQIQGMLQDKGFINQRFQKEDQKNTAISHGSLNLDELHILIKSKIETGADHAELIDTFGRNSLGYLAPIDGVGVELGVASGYFSESILHANTLNILYSIDRYTDHHNDNEFNATCMRLSKFGDRSAIIRKSFAESLGDFSDDSIDFIYIDAYAHQGMVADLFSQWRPKLKDGALIAGHDFCQRFWPNNYKSIMSLRRYSSDGKMHQVRGILTANSEDIIPSFFFYYAKMQ